MVQRSISIQLIWTDRPFPQRAVAAAAAGFDLVDLWDRRTSDLDNLAKACADNGIGINGFFGNRDHGLCDPAQRDAVLEEIGRNLDEAVRVGARQLHVFSNAIAEGGMVVPIPEVPRAAAICVGLETLAAAAELAEGSGVQLMLEHLNPVHLPGYLWDDASVAGMVARQLDHPGVRAVFDTYHQQLGGGRLVDNLLSMWPWLGRIDIAGVPGRCEPGCGEIDFAYLNSVITNKGWDGTVTFEVTPSDGNPDHAVEAINRLFHGGRVSA